MTLPNFLIVGAAKSGTTSLYHYLLQHPDIHMSAKKEPHYFTDWRQEVRSREEYEELFSGWSGEKAVGEASTGYLYDALSPARIRREIPDAKIIIILRNPAEMAFALWGHMRRIGKRGEKLSFKAALAAEPRRLSDPEHRLASAKSWHGNFYYFNRALYYDQVKRYIDTFGRDRVLVLLFDHLVADPVEVCRRTFDFLQVDPTFIPKIKTHNKGLEVRHRGLAKLLSRHPVPSVGMDASLWARVCARVVHWLSVLNTRPPRRMDENIRKLLMEQYLPDIKKLEELIMKDLSGWYAGQMVDRGRVDRRSARGSERL